MSNYISMNFMSMAAKSAVPGDNKPAYTATTTPAEGNIFKQETKYVYDVGNPAAPKIASIMNWQKDEKGFVTAEKYTDTDDDGAWDTYQRFAEQEGGKLIELGSCKNCAKPDEETKLEAMNLDPKERPVYMKDLSTSEIAVFDQVVAKNGNEVTKLRFADFNGDTKLAQDELCAVIKVKVNDCDSDVQDATVYVDKSNPKDGKYDEIQEQVLRCDGKFHIVPDMTKDVSKEPASSREMQKLYEQ